MNETKKNCDSTIESIKSLSLPFSPFSHKIVTYRHLFIIYNNFSIDPTESWKNLMMHDFYQILNLTRALRQR